MFEVTVRIADSTALSEQVETMRTWFDRRRFEPAVFRCSYSSYRAIVVQVQFIVETEATEFAQAFDGEVTIGSPLAI